MLYNLINKFKHVFEPVSDQQTLDKFIADHNPTSVADVEYLMKVFDQQQYNHRSSVFLTYNT